MEDREVVAAVVAGDPAGLGEAYDRYAVALNAYCRSMLREPADAADAVQDTFVVAASKLGGLRDPGKLRSWLYAVARNECLRRLRTRNVTFALEEAAFLPGDSADVGSATEHADLRELVRNAIDGLNPGDQDVIELSLGHALDGDDLAATLGVSRNHAHALLSRARIKLERSLGALIVARTGRHACPVLEAMLAGWDGQMTVLLRKRISRHIEQCDICGERKRRELTPALFSIGLPLVALMPGFRDHVLRLCLDHTSAALAHRASVLGHVGRFGPTGFPKPLSPPGTLPWHGAVHHSPAVVASAAASTATAAVLAVVVIGGAPHHGPPSAAEPGRAIRPNAVVSAVGRSSSPGTHRSNGGIGLAPSASGVATAPGPAATSATTATPGAAVSPGASRTPGATGSPGTTDTPSPSFSAPSPSPSVSSSSTARGEGTLVISPGTVILVPGNGTATGTLTLTASGGPVMHYQITVRSAHELSVSPSSGSLAAGASVTVTVTTTSPGPINAWIIVNPGGNKVTVQLS